MTRIPAVDISALSKHFPQWELRHLLTCRLPPGVWAVKEVELRLWPGESLCILGPNGSGKTTLIKLIATLLLPTEGSIRVHGLDTTHVSARVRARLGLVTCNEESFYGRLTGWQNLAFFARLQRLEPQAAIPPVADILQLTAHLDQRFFAYSTGTRRRLDLARALLHGPDILLLDEPTANLDPLNAEEVRHLLAQLKEQGKTLIMVTHRLEEAALLGGRLAIMREGRLHEVFPADGADLTALYRRVVLGDEHVS